VIVFKNIYVLKDPCRPVSQVTALKGPVH
ncbi:uncharacterized protein METZ01_LOCUS368364, partial [marine metagenome]